MAWMPLDPQGAEAARGDVYVVHYEEEGTSGYVYVDNLGVGKDGQVNLVRSIDTGELAAKKFAYIKDANKPSVKKSTLLPSLEVGFMKGLTDADTGLTPRLISVEGCERFPRSMTMEYCNGGTVFDYYHNTLTKHPQQARQAFLWLVLGDVLRSIVFLSSGYTYIPPGSEKWIGKGKWVAPPYLPWVPIMHADIHTNNLMLTFEAGKDTPRVLLNDFSRARHRANFRLPQGVSPDFAEVDYFLKWFLELAQRPSLAIKRKVEEIRTALRSPDSTLLDLMKGGLYDDCIHNYQVLGVKFPIPPQRPRGGLPKAFSLTRGSFGYLASRWEVREVLQVGVGSHKLLRIPKEDISKLGQVDLARATVVSKGELFKMTGFFDDSEESYETEVYGGEPLGAINLKTAGVLAQEILV